VAGIVHHDAWDDLERCLVSVAGQSAPPVAVQVVDTGTDRAQFDAARARHSDVHFELRPNRGYGAGANRILAEVARTRPDTEFVLILNPDVELEPGFAESLLSAVRVRPRVAIASGKLLRPESRLIDSAGIQLSLYRRPKERGSEQRDRGQFDRTELVFGVSGAAMLLRREALSDLSLDGEVFDEDFFAYYEDTDLCWRAHKLGWSVLYEPAARAFHTRGWRRGQRRNVSLSLRRHSFKNHYLQLLKNECSGDFLRRLPPLLGWELVRLGYFLACDPRVLPAYADAVRAAPRVWHKRTLLKRRVRARAEPPLV
jgi:GT2 family glycosyltransferase